MDKPIILLVLLGTLAGQLVQFHLGGFEISLLDIGALFFLAAFVVTFLKDKDFRVFLITPPFKYLAIWVGVLLLSLVSILPLVNPSLLESLIAILYFGRLVAYLSVLPLICWPSPKVPLIRTDWIYWSAILIVLLGVTQMAIFPDFQIYDHFGWDPHKHRLISSFLDPNFTAIWLVLIFSLSTSVLASRRNLSFAPLLWVTTVSSLLGIILTVSRSGWIALAVACAILVGVYFRKVGLVVLVGGALLISTIAPLSQRLSGIIDLDTTARYRLESWEGALNIVRQYPLLGVGFNTLKFTRYDHALPGTSKVVSRFEDGIIRPAQISNRADAGFDSSLLTILATGGIVGLLAFLWMVWNMLLTALTKVTVSKLPYSTAFWASTGALFVSSWFVNAWLYPPILLLWLIIFTLSYGE